MSLVSSQVDDLVKVADLEGHVDSVSWRITYFFSPNRVASCCSRSSANSATTSAARSGALAPQQTRTDMTRTKWTELRDARLATFNNEERAEYDRAYRAAALAGITHPAASGLPRGPRSTCTHMNDNGLKPRSIRDQRTNPTAITALMAVIPGAG